jgi:hypothetical protein
MTIVKIDATKYICDSCERSIIEFNDTLPKEWEITESVIDNRLHSTHNCGICKPHEAALTPTLI